MADFKISELMAMQDELQARMKGKWLEITPENGHYSLLWMYEEMGEIVAALKKRGNRAVMDSPAVRSAFLEEMSDVLMYYIDLAACFGVSAGELSEAYAAKHATDMRRDYITEHGTYLEYKNGAERPE